MTLNIFDQRLWQKGMEMKAFDLSNFMRKSIESKDWMNVKEPKRISKIWNLVEEEIAAIDRNTSQIYKSTEKLSPPSTISSGKGLKAKSFMLSWLSRVENKKSSSYRSKGAANDPLGYNLDRIFTEKIVFYEKLPMSHIKANTFIVKIIFKASFLTAVLFQIFDLWQAFLEIVRTKTFSTFGFQQIQLDIEWIKGNFWKYMEKPK